MRQKTGPAKAPAAQVVKEILRATRRQFSAEDASTAERQSLGLLLSRLARLGFGQIYVSRPLPYGHRSPAEQQGRYADENGCGKKIKPAHVMRPEQGLEPVWKARRLRHPALGTME